MLFIENMHQKHFRCLFKDNPGPHPDLLNQNFWKQGPGSCILTECQGDSYACRRLKTTAFDSVTLRQRYGLTAVWKIP